MWNLSGSPERDFVRHAHGGCNDGARLHGGWDQALVDEATGYNHICFGLDLSVVATEGNRGGVAVVGALVLMDDGGALGKCGFHVDHGWEYFVVDVDQIECIRC